MHQCCAHGVVLVQVLGNPGSGKSSLLKAVAGRLPPKHLNGVANYNGVPLSRYENNILNVAKYVEQEERHLPLLTVRETLEYAERFQREVRGVAVCCEALGGRL